MPGPSELQVVLRVAEQLGEELGQTHPGSTAGERVSPEHGRLAPWEPADVEKARWVARMSAALARVATAAAGQAREDADEGAMEKAAAALAKTELVIRGELMRGDEAALREQLPGFVFLVVLPTAGMDRALELANRARVLLAEALPGLRDA